MNQQNNIVPTVANTASEKFGAFQLLFEENFFKIFQIFLLFTLVVSAVISINHYFLKI